jgi:hypothetical protein
LTKQVPEGFVDVANGVVAQVDESVQYLVEYTTAVDVVVAGNVPVVVDVVVLDVDAVDPVVVDGCGVDAPVDPDVDGDVDPPVDPVVVNPVVVNPVVVDDIVTSGLLEIGPLPPAITHRNASLANVPFPHPVVASRLHE